MTTLTICPLFSCNSTSTVEQIIDASSPWDGAYYYVDDVSVSINTGIGNFENNGGLDFNLFPNPADSQISVEFDLLEEENVSIEILDMLGQSLFVTTGQLLKGTQSVTLEISDLPKGIYFVQVKTKSTFGSIKFVKE